MEYGLWHTLTEPALLSHGWFTVWQSSLTVGIALLAGGGDKSRRGGFWPCAR
jgi:hypothetical protein